METLTPKIIAELKSELEQDKDRLTQSLHSIATQTDDGDWIAIPDTEMHDDGARADDNDNADEVEEFEDRVATLVALEQEYNDIVDALKKIAADDGSYGTCEETGEPIDIERLRAHPAARTGIES